MFSKETNKKKKILDVTTYEVNPSYLVILILLKVYFVFLLLCNLLCSGKKIYCEIMTDLFWNGGKKVVLQCPRFWQKYYQRIKN
jgi:hypothetical protein